MTGWAATHWARTKTMGSKLGECIGATGLRSRRTVSVRSPQSIMLRQSSPRHSQALADQPISAAAHRYHKPRLALHGSQFGAEAAHVHIHQVVAGHIRVAPDLPGERRTLEDRFWLTRKRRQQPELRGREVHPLIVERYGSAFHRDRELSDVDLGGFGHAYFAFLCGAPQQSVHARFQVLDVEGLGNEVVCPHLESEH